MMDTPELPIPQELSRLLALCQTAADLPPDFEYARLSRQARQGAFCEAICRLELARAIVSAFSWAAALTRSGMTDEFLTARREEDHCLAAVFRAPAGSRWDLGRKKRLLRQARKFTLDERYGRNFSMTAAEVEACIDRDEAWLAAHPMRRAGVQ
jgi:hypothetical protein